MTNEELKRLANTPAVQEAVYEQLGTYEVLKRLHHDLEAANGKIADLNMTSMIAAELVKGKDGSLNKELLLLYKQLKNIKNLIPEIIKMSEAQDHKNEVLFHNGVKIAESQVTFFLKQLSTLF